jgi:hypothetical protein
MNPPTSIDMFTVILESNPATVIALPGVQATPA